MHYDVFNGDADGIIALLQLRLSKKKPYPQESILVTGVKRDISLLKQVDIEKASSVTVLDISLEKNLDPLIQLLEKNIAVFYVDHHRTGDVPSSKALTRIINTDANICTSLLVNSHLKNEFLYWAIAAAFGDNMETTAQALALKHKVSAEQEALLKELGIYINYNGYGRNVDDLHFHPAQLFKKLLPYTNPFDLMDDKDSIFYQLKSAYLADMAQAEKATVLVDNEQLNAVQLADEPWARRVSGVFSNALANASPDKAHIVVTINKQTSEDDRTYTISLRAPLMNKQGAGDICARFPTGGGRSAAAGVNALPEKMLGDFFTSVSKYYQLS